MYRMARHTDRNQAGKSVQQVRLIKDRDGNIITSKEGVLRRWKKYFEELNDENKREHKKEKPEIIRKRVD